MTESIPSAEVALPIWWSVCGLIIHTAAWIWLGSHGDWSMALVLWALTLFHAWEFGPLIGALYGIMFAILPPL